MAISLDTLSTREGVLIYPNQAAETIAADPQVNTDPVITNEVLSTRAGCLRFPNQAAEQIAIIADTSSSS